MSKLINTYAYLREVYEDLDITHDTPPKYVQTLTGNDDGSKINKIIFIYHFKQSSNLMTSSNVKEPTPSPARGIKSENDSDIVGSPLRDDCEVQGIGSPVLGLQDFDPWEEVNNFTGVKIETARNVLNTLVDKKVMKEDSGSVWILCNGTDCEKTLFLEIEATPGWWTRGVVVSKGKTEMVDASSLVKRHQAMIRFGSEPKIIIDSFFSFNNYTVIRCSNDKIHSLNFFRDTTITLYQTFNLAEHQSLAMDLFSQIFLLHTIYDTIVRYREDYDEDSGDPEYRGADGVTQGIIVEEISKIFSSVPEHNLIIEDDEEVRSPLKNAVLQAKKRQLIRVTDQLWDILRLCSTFKDLKSALGNIFVLAAKSNIVNMPQTTTKLGELVVDISNQRIAIPHLTGCQPLELLLEIGIEKLSHDFEFIFSQASICTEAELQTRTHTVDSKVDTVINVRKSLHNVANLKSRTTTHAEQPKRKTLLASLNSNDQDTSDIGFQNSRFNRSESEKRISRLLQIYYTLEHLLLLNANIGTDSVNVVVAKKLLQQEPENTKKILKSSVRAHKIKVDVVDEKLRDIIHVRQPSALRVSIKSDNSFKKLETVHYYSEHPLVPPHLYPNLFTEEEFSSTVNDLEENKYWLASYTKISSKIK